MTFLDFLLFPFARVFLNKKTGLSVCNCALRWSCDGNTFEDIPFDGEVQLWFFKLACFRSPKRLKMMTASAICFVLLACRYSCNVFRILLLSVSMSYNLWGDFSPSARNRVQPVQQMGQFGWPFQSSASSMGFVVFFVAIGSKMTNLWGSNDMCCKLWTGVEPSTNRWPHISAIKFVAWLVWKSICNIFYFKTIHKSQNTHKTIRTITDNDTSY